MKFISNKTIYILLILSLLLSSCINTKNKEYFAEKGIIDISKHNFETEGIIKLNGEWEFYYGQLLEPTDFIENNNKLHKTYINVPQSWTRQTNHESYPEQGYATYRLIIISDKEIVPIILGNQRIFTASKTWFNGKLLSEIGKTGRSKSEYKADLKLLLTVPVNLKTKNELIIQVSNFYDRRAGILNPVRIGEAKKLFSYKTIELIIIVAVLSIIFIIGLYHFILFLFRRSDYSNLVFSILAFLIVIMGIVGNDTLLKNIVNPGFETITRLFHSVISLYPALIALFFYLLFKKEVNKHLIISVIIFSALLLIFSLFFDISLVRKHILIKIIFIFIVSVYFVFYSLPKAIIKKRQGAIWAFIGMLILFSANMNDNLFALDYVKTGYFGIYGFAAYIIFQSLNFAERFSSSYKKNKRLTKEIKNQNSEYKLLNKDYQIQNEELILAKEKAERSDKLKSAFLANMSHEIRTPMNAILGFSNLLNNREIEKDKRKELIGYIIRSGDSLLQLINDIIDVSKIEAGQLEINKKECNLNEAFNELKNIYAEKKEDNFNKNIELKFINNNEDLIIRTDNIRLKQILINLIDNALKFTEKGFVEIGFSIDVSSNNNNIIFYVKDTGIGMSNKQQNSIFNRFTKLEEQREKLYRGAGLGLAISKDIVQLLGGKIWLESELNKGTTFYFNIPGN